VTLGVMRCGRYEIKEELGRGSMGIVYSAYDPQIGRRVAIKVLREDRITSEEFAQRFLQEAIAVGRLSHPNIITVYDAGQDGGRIYIVMEFLVGKPLNDVLRERKLSFEELTGIGVQVAEALDLTHSKGIVHRDIKPSNIFLTSENRAIITDFGIARLEDDCKPYQTRTGVILGSPAYMSPEQVLCHAVDGRADLFSLGVILYEAGTGRRPFEGDDLLPLFKAILEDAPLDPRKVDPSIPNSLSKLIMRSINKSPEKRFQTGKEMAEALKTCLKSREPQTVRKPWAIKRSLLIVALAVILFLGLGSGGSWFYYRYYYRLALLQLESSPVGAEVFMDGLPKGVTPLKLRLPIGQYEVRMSMKDHYDWEAQLELDKKDKVPVFVKLVPVEKNQP